MVKAMMQKVKGLERNFLLFLLAGVFIGVAQSVDGSTFTNFLKEKFDIAILERTALEMPRELPGLLVFLIIGVLYTLGDIRIAAIANLCAALGMLLLGTISSSYTVAVMFIFIYSAGQHVYMPLANSIGMSFANDGRLGRKLGQLSAAGTASLVLSSALLWCLFKFFHISYRVSFLIGSMSFLIAAVLLFMMKKPQNTTQVKTRFVFKKEYRLFYWLCILYGARKQLFITFGTWVLVDIFKQPVTSMVILFFIISSMGIVVKPLIGYMIDRVGEKTVLSGEAALIFFVCLGYAFSNDLLKGTAAVVLVSGCYILDQTSSAVSMARATYLKKIALKPEDVSPTLSLGISIDHIVSMFLPTLGGLVWYNGGANGYKYVFLGGAVIALINFFSARRILKTSVL